ncbi:MULTISPECIES: dynamin family protein [Rhodococcus]|uniref:dynamin family protein n=1 Tax=Rhodococcus TaxID=1827 RepID=UPI001E46E682|nr:dynamin family protein [Rhodococcus pyridinivorans]MCD2116111.1 dynamin family protein [Rhodococcus pyridinivorans]MCZ4624978.1 dynamin family protein [Rhodococcus pyridinivorans]MCZ4646503.1 dynamin family protein [Rhodococcus pyridinivorans]MDJ0482694.1 dynamin family protein [Rhodococcus pyridinivorans]MDV7252290.1 dynamin family protein [Rhodococcus pyridinivorans]
MQHSPDTQHPSDPSRRRALLDLIDSAIARSRSARRNDLTDRLTAARTKVSDPRLRVVVVGGLNQGKSRFVNALLGLEVCSVGDDETTAVPTLVQHGQEPSAELVPTGSAPRIAVPFDDLQQVAPRSAGRDVDRLEVSVPSPLLADGLVFVDTPGVGGHGNPHTAATLTLLATADAVFVVSDASQEFTAPEMSFLRQVQTLCPASAVLVTKTDVYPHWRAIVDADREHLQRAGIDLPLLPVSSLLREYALRTEDASLQQESGFDAIYDFLREQVVARNADSARLSVAHDVKTVVDHLALGCESELAALRDPDSGNAAIEDLHRARAATEALRTRAARWQITLSDGIADLAADIDHDLRDRLRTVTRDAEASVDDCDPGKEWPRLGQWLAEQVAESVGDNFVWAHERAEALAGKVAEHFALDDDSLPSLHLGDLSRLLEPVENLSDLESGRIGLGQKVLVGMKGSYGGVLMFGLVTTLMGMALVNPISVGAGVVLGTKAYRDDKQVRLAKRRVDAKSAIRAFTDDVSFQVGKESKDRLRLIQRQLRDHFTEIAEQTLRSLDESLEAARQAATVQEQERRRRIGELDTQVAELGRLRERAAELAEVSA